ELPGRPLALGDEGLELTDRDRQRVLADDAVPLAEAFLRAEAAAHLRELARLAEDVRGAVDVALLELPERARNVVVDRARLLTRRCGALDAALRLDLRRLKVEQVVDLVPFLDAG